MRMSISVSMSLTSHAVSMNTASKYTCMHTCDHPFPRVRSYGQCEVRVADRNEEHC